MAAATEQYGIAAEYRDVFGQIQAVPERTRRALLAAMHVDPQSPPDVDPSGPICIPEGQLAELGPGELQLEGGARMRIKRRAPRDVPLGYHTFLSDGTARPQRVIVYPATCYLPDNFKCWGWAVPLYATRSHDSWGIGDLADLRRFGHWSREAGASFLLLNPLNAPSPTVPQEASPYQPTSRLFRNPLYLRVEEIPADGRGQTQLEVLAAEGRALNAQRRIDRDRVFSLKMEALKSLWTAARQKEAGLEEYVRGAGPALLHFATYCVLAERFGPSWRKWDAEYQHPDNSAVARFREAHRERITFHQWVQWQLDEQLGRAAVETALVTDLPIGSDPTGSDAWMWQDALAVDASIGAPPDRYNPAGQDWGAAPFIPHRLRGMGYEPLVQTIRAALRHARGLRIDHVMGLFRQFWIPRGESPEHGGFVHYAPGEMLAIVALESHRHRAWVAGEDLGTVDPEVPEQLATRQILSHRLIWFEEDPPARYPRLSLAAATTHDLSTIAGAWSGSDVEDERRIGRQPREEYVRQIRERLGRVIQLDDQAQMEEVIVAAHRALAAAPSAVVVANLTDALAVTERLNMPGVNSWPNWSLALPQPLEAIEQDDLPQRVAGALRRRARRSG